MSDSKLKDVYLRYIVRTLVDLNEKPNGSSQIAIKKWILANHKKDVGLGESGVALSIHR